MKTFAGLLLAVCAAAGVISSLPSKLEFSELSGRDVSPNNTCGTTGAGGNSNGYTCPSDLPCCSVNGFCGSTNEYCLTTVGCQAGFGSCIAPTSGTVSPDMTCGLSGAGTAGYTCPSGSSCCSVSGWCGSTADYCSATSGCQSAFGTCDNSTAATPITRRTAAGTRITE